MLRKIRSLIEKQWKTLLAVIGVGAASDVAKEYFRGKALDWMSAKLGPLGTWLIANPTAFLTSALCCLLLGLLASVAVESLWPPPSQILDHTQTPFPRVTTKSRWILGFGVIIICIVVVVGYGEHKYYQYSHKPAPPGVPGHLAIAFGAIPFRETHTFAKEDCSHSVLLERSQEISHAGIDARRCDLQKALPVNRTKELGVSNLRLN